MFVTKIWNMGRYMEHILSPLDGIKQEHIIRSAISLQQSLHLYHTSPKASHPIPPAIPDSGLSQYIHRMSLADKAIIMELHRLVYTVTHALLDKHTDVGCGSTGVSGSTGGSGSAGVSGNTGGSGVAQLSEAGKAIQEFLRSEFADWYIEVCDSTCSCMYMYIYIYAFLCRSVKYNS